MNKREEERHQMNRRAAALGFAVCSHCDGSGYRCRTCGKPCRRHHFHIERLGTTPRALRSGPEVAACERCQGAGLVRKESA